MNNAVRYIDILGAKAGDTFSSMDDAAVDFGEAANGKSIEEGVEYGAYIYSWKETKKIFGFIPVTKTFYSYTESYTDKLQDHLDSPAENLPIPVGTT